MDNFKHGAHFVSTQLLRKRLEYYSVNVVVPDQWVKPNAYRCAQGLYEAWAGWTPTGVKHWRKSRGRT